MSTNRTLKAVMLAATLCSATTVAAAQTDGAGKDAPQAGRARTVVEAVDARQQPRAEGKAGADCEPKRAGTRCSRPKPRKPWFFGK